MRNKAPMPSAAMNSINMKAVEALMSNTPVDHMRSKIPTTNRTTARTTHCCCCMQGAQIFIKG